MLSTSVVHNIIVTQIFSYIMYHNDYKKLKTSESCKTLFRNFINYKRKIELRIRYIGIFLCRFMLIFTIPPPPKSKENIFFFIKSYIGTKIINKIIYS